MTERIKRGLRRRAAVEPVISHLKAEHRMGRNHLAHAAGDAINAVLAAAGYNFRRFLAWLRLFFSWLLATLAAIKSSPSRAVEPNPHSSRATNQRLGFGQCVSGIP